jgi:hypothetical protein
LVNGHTDFEAFGTCYGKGAWRDRIKAHKVARRMARAKARKVAVYRCAACGLWHIGHLSGSPPGRKPQSKVHA